MLEVNIKKYMPGFKVTVDFVCDNGNLVVITGPSGAGKTTLIRILAGLETADEGFIRYEGRTWYDSGMDANLTPQSRGIGYVFQEHTLFPHLTVRENVSFVEKDMNKVHNLLKLFNISHVSEQKPNHISGGERQRAAFAQALSKNPKVLLLDEPFSALDSGTRNRLQYELKKIKKNLAIPIIHVTHDPLEAEYLADKVVHIERKFQVSCLLGKKHDTNCGVSLHSHSDFQNAS